MKNDESKTAQPTVDRIDTKIRSIICVEDSDPEAATLFQGFAPSLAYNSHSLRAIRRLPVDLYEFLPENHDSRIGPKISGTKGITWMPLSAEAIQFMSNFNSSPFTIIFSHHQEDTSALCRIRRSAKVPFIIVSEEGGDISPIKFDFDGVRDLFLQHCERCEGAFSNADLEEVKSLIERWSEPELEYSGLDVGGHGSIVPNQSAAYAAGIEIKSEEPFRDISNESSYTAQIKETAECVLSIRERNPFSIANKVFPRRPDLNIFAPSTYDLKLFNKVVAKFDGPARKKLMSSVQVLEKQAGYSYMPTSRAGQEALLWTLPAEATGVDGEPAGLNPIISIRQKELWLNTEVVSTLAASEVSAVIRLPNRINRTKGGVRQFSQHYRADKPQYRKRGEMFRELQRRISSGVPADLMKVIRQSKDGIRIVADAHLEWLDIDGVPLCLARETCRLPVTPGNLFVANTVHLDPIHLAPSHLSEILVITGLDDKDLIAGQFESAFAVFGKAWGDRITLKHVYAKTEDDLVDALNSFSGNIVFFDGHGSHKEDQPGVIWLGDTPVDVWPLRDRILRMPPIVVLSACDTHAADRNHATVANGFLSLGARAVLGSVFPLHASAAASFAARLIYRIAEFVPAAVKQFGRSLTWLEVVAGMLRRHAATDILRHFERLGLIEKGNVKLHTECGALADFRKEDAFSEIKKKIIELGVDKARVEREMASAIASSSTISYLHLGRPESIVLNTEENIRKVLGDESGQKSTSLDQSPLPH